MPLALLFAAVGCENPADPEVRNIQETELAIVFTFPGGSRPSDTLRNHRLRIAFDGYATYERLAPDGRSDIAKFGDLGMAGFDRLDSIFLAVNYPSLGIHSDASDSLYCVQNGFAFYRISYRPTLRSSFHSLTDAACFTTPPAGFTILRNKLLYIINDSLEDY
jgi:hypothetical protein